MNSVILYFKLAMYNFPVTMTVLAIILAFFCSIFKTERTTSDIFLGKLMFFAVGLSGIWGFIMHAFYPEMAAKFIGWPNSPFQFEVAVANLGMGVAGVFGLYAKKSYRIATTIFTTCFLWGAAYGHIVQMNAAGNFAPGNAGSIFYNDLIMPALLILFLLYNKCDRCRIV